MSNENKLSMHPCPICQKSMFVTGRAANGASLTSCGHKFKFKKTKSEKIADREWIRTPWGLERVASVGKQE